jgi:hypothetical protein
VTDYEKLDLRIKFVRMQVEAARICFDLKIAGAPNEALEEFLKADASLKQAFHEHGIKLD